METLVQDPAPLKMRLPGYKKVAREDLMELQKTLISNSIPSPVHSRSSSCVSSSPTSTTSSSTSPLSSSPDYCRHPSYHAIMPTAEKMRAGLLLQVNKYYDREFVSVYEYTVGFGQLLSSIKFPIT